MEIWDWLITRDWAATGAMLTAAFTGFSGWWLIATRPRPKMRIEMESLSHSLDRGEVSFVYAFRNVGTGPAFEVRVFVTAEGLPDKQQVSTVAALAPGEDVKLSRRRDSIAGTLTLDEKTGLYPDVKPDFDPKTWGVAVTWTQPPLSRRTRGLRASERELLSAYHARYHPDG